MTTAGTRPERKTRVDIRVADVAKLFERLPPHSAEAEMSLLGAMVFDPAKIPDVIDIIGGETDFYKPAHGQIYQAIVGLWEANGSLDLVQLNERLRDFGVLDEVGGSDYLVRIAEDTPLATHAEHYANIVRDKALLRGLIRAGGKIIHDAFNATEAANLVVDQAEKEIFEISQTHTGDDPQSLGELITKTWELLEMRRESGEVLSGVETDFRVLDEKLGGLQKSDLIILAARPSVGKTALAMNMAEYIAVDSHRPVAVFSLEMSRQQLAERLLCSRAGVSLHRLRGGHLSEGEVRRLQERSDELKQAPMYIDDTPGLSVLALRAKARRLKLQHEIQTIFVDYLQLMTSPGAESRQQEVSEISRGVKALGRELEVPVVCLSQLNRNPEGRESKRPMLSDLRESGAIEQDADVVLMLHREDYYHRNDAEQGGVASEHKPAELLIAKQRNGPTGIVKLQFHEDRVRFENYTEGVGIDLDAIEETRVPAEDNIPI